MEDLSADIVDSSVDYGRIPCSGDAVAPPPVHRLYHVNAVCCRNPAPEQQAPPGSPAREKRQDAGTASRV